MQDRDRTSSERASKSNKRSNKRHKTIKKTITTTLKIKTFFQKFLYIISDPLIHIQHH